MDVHACMCVHVHVYMCMYTCVYVCMCACAYVCSVCVHICGCVFACTHVCKCVHVCMCVMYVDLQYNVSISITLCGRSTIEPIRLGGFWYVCMYGGFVMAACLISFPELYMHMYILISFSW